MTVTELVASAIQSNDQGLTILGGEPLEQPTAIYSLIEEAKEKGLSIFLYSGFEDKELTTLQRKCVDASDIVILGRYVQAKRDTSLRWRGSSNQKVMFTSDRYAHLEIQEANEGRTTLLNNVRENKWLYSRGKGDVLDFTPEEIRKL